MSTSLHEDLADFFERAPLGVVAVDADGRVTETNPAACQILRVGRAALHDVPLHVLCHPAERIRLALRLQQLARGERDSFRGDLTFRIRDGAVTVLACTATALRSGAEYHGAVLLLDEVTERRRDEVHHRHQQKLEAVGRLAAGVAHEINTPIQFVGDNLHFLNDAFDHFGKILAAYRTVASPDCGARSWAERQQMLADAEAEGDIDFFLSEVHGAVRDALDGVARIATIVRALKSFGHPDGEHPCGTNLNELVANAIIVARGELKDVATVDASYGPLPLVTCFPGDLSQVVLNLLVNAAHAIADHNGGSAALGRITVRTAIADEEALIEIADTGGGIPAEIQDRIMEPFFTTKEVGRGTGQGLALARAVVERHRGRLEFETVPGVGTTFRISIPIDLANRFGVAA